MSAVDPPRPSRSLRGKVAIALLLAEDGATIVCVDREEALAQRTAELVLAENEGASALAVEANVSSAEECARVVDAALRVFRRVDILVNNVGVLGPPGTAVDVDVPQWARGLEVNVTSMMLMAKYAVPAMRENEPEAGVRGSIVNLGSVAGLRGGTPSLLYPTSKGAVVNMTRAMAAHHAKDGVRVNCVCPGEDLALHLWESFALTFQGCCLRPWCMLPRGGCRRR
ncbi:hypothetical protein J3458_015646 [Metarhizium acridum]|uniref:uncharacterized protein n=1 Tax=Metarhizium acridum TaxID=92637 RepID=UPI001C6C9876|nr:hypothetical protein J3458_015646 [Metarhizium acridum]